MGASDNVPYLRQENNCLFRKFDLPCRVDPGFDVGLADIAYKS